VGWTGGDVATSVVTNALGGVFRSIHAFGGETQAFETVTATGPAFLNNLSQVDGGDGLWLFSHGDTFWEQPVITGARSVALSAGFNLVTWTGLHGMPIADALASLGEAVESAFTYEELSDTFLSFGPALPPALNTLAALAYGEALWLRVSEARTWEQPAPPAGSVAVSADGLASVTVPVGQSADLVVRAIPAEEWPAEINGQPVIAGYTVAPAALELASGLRTSNGPFTSESGFWEFEVTPDGDPAPIVTLTPTGFTVSPPPRQFYDGTADGDFVRTPIEYGVSEANRVSYRRPFTFADLSQEEVLIFLTDAPAVQGLFEFNHETGHATFSDSPFGPFRFTYGPNDSRQTNFDVQPGADVPIAPPNGFCANEAARGSLEYLFDTSWGDHTLKFEVTDAELCPGGSGDPGGGTCMPDVLILDSLFDLIDDQLNPGILGFDGPFLEEFGDRVDQTRIVGSSCPLTEQQIEDWIAPLIPASPSADGVFAPGGDAPLGQPFDVFNDDLGLLDHLHVAQADATPYVIVAMELVDAVPLASEDLFFVYAAVFDRDGNPTNNFVPLPQFPGDYFLGTDLWYEAKYSPISGEWALSRRIVIGGAPRFFPTDALVLIAGNVIYFVIPQDEFTVGSGEDLPFRMTAFTYDKTDPFGFGAGLAAGDTTPFVLDPLALLPLP